MLFLGFLKFLFSFLKGSISIEVKFRCILCIQYRFIGIVAVSSWTFVEGGGCICIVPFDSYDK